MRVLHSHYEGWYVWGYFDGVVEISEYQFQVLVDEGRRDEFVTTVLDKVGINLPVSVSANGVVVLGDCQNNIRYGPSLHASHLCRGDGYTWHRAPRVPLTFLC